jgi:hypothetical protein
VRLAPGSDNWPVTWADDNHQYTTWGDGGGFGGTNENGRVSLGFGRVEGDASAYTGVNLWGGFNAPVPAQFYGKSFGILGVGGNLYAWRCGEGSGVSAFKFQRLYISPDHGLTWNYTGLEFNPTHFGATKGFFCPSFLQYGKDYAGALDSYVYMYAPENVSNNWDMQKPGNISLFRAPKTALSDRGQYEFFAGLDGGGNPQWTSDILSRAPVFSDATNGVMLASVNYNAGLQRYFLITEHTRRAVGDIAIYDGPAPWGPWTAVLVETGWGAPAIEASTFIWNFSNKWTSVDGLNFVMVFSGRQSNDSWNTVAGSFSVSGGSPPPPPPPEPTPTFTPSPTPVTPTNTPAPGETPPAPPPPTATSTPGEEELQFRLFLPAVNRP